VGDPEAQEARMSPKRKGAADVSADGLVRDDKTQLLIVGEDFKECGDGRLEDGA